MPPKPFTLDSVLKYRKRQESMAQEKFIQAKADAEMAFQALEEAKNALGNLINTLEEKQISGILAMELARFEERIQYARDQIELLKVSYQKKKKIVKDKRLLLLEKSRNYKVLDTLKEQQNRTWKNYLDKKEAAMLDEIAILRHDRKTS